MRYPQDDQDHALTPELLAAAWRALNDAAGDLALLAAVATDGALACDATVLADAVERELEALFASAVRWQARG